MVRPGWRASSRSCRSKNSRCVFLLISLQTFLHHLILWGSILLSFLWFAIYGVLANLFWDMYYVPYVTMATVEFWSVCAFSAIAALLPRYSCLFSVFVCCCFALRRNTNAKCLLRAHAAYASPSTDSGEDGKSCSRTTNLSFIRPTSILAAMALTAFPF